MEKILIIMLVLGLYGCTNPSCLDKKGFCKGAPIVHEHWGLAYDVGTHRNVFLNDSTVLYGKILSYNDDSLTIQTNRGKVVVPRENIKTVK